MMFWRRETGCAHHWHCHPAIVRRGPTKHCDIAEFKSGVCCRCLSIAARPAQEWYRMQSAEWDYLGYEMLVGHAPVIDTVAA